MRRRLIDPLHIVDVFVYVVVLNLAAQFVPAVIAESFAVSILTAILLKLLLDALTGLERRVSGYFRARDGAINRALGLFSVWAILFFGKFLILEVVNIVFGDEVELGHFIEIFALIVTMIVVRGAMQWIYVRLGEVPTSEA
ncbi:MAG: hypothetical protein ABUL47_06085 [Leifsonia sp.]